MRIAIIGAGYGGMAAAWDLRKAGHEVIIFESADYVGRACQRIQRTALGLVGREVLSSLVSNRFGDVGIDPRTWAGRQGELSASIHSDVV